MNNERRIDHAALADLAHVGAVSRWIPGSPVLHVLDHAPDSNLPPLLISPGITMPAVGMAFVAAELTDLVRPLVLDNRGRGLSGTGVGYCASDYAEDLARVIEELHLEDCIVLGHSMGARGAALLASSRPELVRAALLVDPPLSGPGKPPYPTSEEVFMSQLHEAQAGTTVAQVAKSWPSWPTREQELRVRWLPSCDETAVQQTHAGFEAEDVLGYWGGLDERSTLIYGENSPVVTQEGLAECHKTNEKVHSRGVSGAGHMVYWDNPAESLRVTKDILEGLFSERSAPEFS